jgi:16S rRNA (cytidine1402-2'-O)-methyltransferase
VSSGLTLPTALNRSLPAKAWKQQPAPLDNDTPAVFLIGR